MPPTVETCPSSGLSERAGALGKVGLRLTVRRGRGELLVKVLQAKDMPTNYRTRTANISIKMALLPSKLPKYSTTVVEDSLNPEFNEDFTFLITASELAGLVLRLTVTDHARGNKNVIGYCLASFDEIGFGRGDETGELLVKEIWLDVKESVKEELRILLSDKLQLSLRYDPDPGRLTLGIMDCRIFSMPLECRELDLYVKVALLEGRQVLKAKKTRVMSLLGEPQEVTAFEEHFSILLPQEYLDSVSCIITLCSRSKLGSKSVLGRTAVGPWTLVSGPGNQHWGAMANHAREEVVKWHNMT